jgi:hypothetical protein
VKVWGDTFQRLNARRYNNRWIDRSQHTCAFDGPDGCAECQRVPSKQLKLNDVYPGEVNPVTSAKRRASVLTGKSLAARETNRRWRQLQKDTDQDDDQ